MNAQNIEKKPTVKRETKNKIRVEFDRTPLKERLKAKFLSGYFLTNLAIAIFRLVLMVGISYIVIFPFISKITSSIMAPEDFIDVTVRLVPKHISFDIYEAIVKELGYLDALGNTFVLSFSTAVIQMLICSLIGYGFAKFKFRGRNLIFVLVMVTMIIPHQTLQHSMYLEFRNFDILGIVRLLKGGGIQIGDWNIMQMGEGVANFFAGLNVLPDGIEVGVDSYGEPIMMQFKQSGMNIANSYLPLILMSATGLAFKNGLYIFMLRQFFRGIPDELEESAYMDGCGTFRTFIQIILPLSIPMMITVFLFAFCWQWTDDFYVSLINTGIETSNQLLVDLVGSVPPSLKLGYAGQTLYETAIRNTCGLMIIAPLVVLYAFCQNFLVQGIEHSGIAN